jgi:hypothetical protein
MIESNNVKVKVDDKNNLNKKEKLRELKDMFDEGLLDEDEFGYGHECQ